MVLSATFLASDKHKNQAEAGLGCPSQVQAVRFGPGKRVFVGLDVFAKLFELCERDKTQPLRLYAGNFEILDISVNAVIGVAFESPV